MLLNIKHAPTFEGRTRTPTIAPILSRTPTITPQQASWDAPKFEVRTSLLTIAPPLSRTANAAAPSSWDD
jgi:hypothetical protein